MNITVEKQENCRALLRVEVPSDTVTTERQSIVQAFSKQARLPGFRPGKAPRAVVEKRFAREIGEELESRLVRQGFQEAIEKESLKVLNAPDPGDSTHHSDGTFSFSSNLVLAPDFELPNYKEITLELPDRKIEDADIAKELENLQQRFAEFDEVTDRALAEGDFAVIDYTGTAGGKSLEDAFGASAPQLDSGEDFWLKMDDESFLPGFSGQLEGAAVDDERTVTVMIEEDYPVEELRGKDVEFAVKVKSIRTQTLPELNDEFAAQIVPGSSLEDLKGLIREQMEQHLDRQLREFKTNQLLDKIASQVEFPLPDDLVASETQNQADRLVEQGMGAGMSEEDIETRQAELFQTAGQQARLNLKTDFLLQEIAAAEGINVEPAELQQQVTAYAQQMNKPVKTFIRDLQRTGRLRGIQHQILLGKTIDFLLEQAKVETVPAEEPKEDHE